MRVHHPILDLPTHNSRAQGDSMSKLKLVVLASAVAAMFPVSAFAQRARTSPHETINGRIDGDMVTIVYGRPYSKSPRGGEIRKIWGSEADKALVPNGKAWRLGADEATLMLTQKPLEFGDVTVPPGAYTLYMVPDENGGKLAISKSLGNWGIPVDEKNDLARVDLKKEPLDKPNDQLAIAVEKNPSGGGVIKIMWEGTQFSAPFTVKK
jgi:hypothetical protein